AGDVAGNVVHRPGAVESDHRNNVLEPVRLQLAQYIAHARTFELEYAGRFGTAKHLIRLLVVERDTSDIELDSALFHKIAGEREYCKGLQPEKIELHKAGLLDIFHVKLGRGQGRARIAVEGHEFVERTIADDDPGGVGGSVAVETLELLCNVDKAGDCRI